MRHRSATTASLALDPCRPHTVGLGIGLLREVSGFRRISLRRPAKVTLEGEWVGLTQHGQRLHRLGGAVRPVVPPRRAKDSVPVGPGARNYHCGGGAGSPSGG